MRDVVNTLLDTVGLALVAAGVGAAVSGAILAATPGAADGMGRVAAGAGLLCAGLVLLAGSWLAVRRGDP